MNVNGFLTKQVRTPIWRRLKTPTKRIITTLGTILLLITGLNYRMMAQDCVTLPPNQQKSCSISKDGTAVDFTVTGRMPAHARVSVTPVERDDEEGNPMLAAYDITLADDQGQEWQPAYGQPAQVTITDPAFGNGRKLDIFHETEEGREYVTTVVSANNTVTFPAKHFSVYVIGTPNGMNRMVVAFVKTRHNDAYSSPDSLLYDTLCMLVKRADTIYNGKFMSRLVYPPNPGYIPEGVNFFGWSRTPDYTAELESRMTIDVVRELVYDRLKNGDEISGDLGDTMMFYSVLLKAHTINYRSLRNPNVVIGVDEVLYLRNDNPVQDYIVNESYIPTETNANFQGWLLMEGDTNVVEGKLPDDIYPNGTSIKIKGDITFMEELAFGYWLVFNENGKGASYTAPKFLRSNDIGAAGDTLSEAEPDHPTRFGYNFDGWYSDPVFSIPFVFEGYLDQDTTIHAKWVAKEQAGFTILVWRQNAARDGYDFAESFSLEGNVGYSIKNQAIVTGKEGDLDYVIVDGKKLGGIKWVLNGQESDPYTGFTLSTVNPIVDQAVTTDGQAVVNIYFDRMKYKLKLYVVRTNANGSGDYKGTSIGKSLNPEAPYFLGNWESGNMRSLSAFPELFGSLPHLYDVSGSYRYYYYTINAYYGENIRDRWPTHEDITVSGSNFVSWFLMSTAKAFVPGANGTGNGTGGNTLKGEVHILDEQILGRLDDSTSNLLMARYESSFCPSTFYIYFADANGDYPDVPSDTILARAGNNNYEFLMDKGPSFEGYTYDKSASSGHNGTTYYVLNYRYRRNSYSITFRDGVYRDGDSALLQNKSSSTPLRLITGVIHGKDISEYNAYRPILPQGEEGFVFEGWYMDEACTKPYTFTTMPAGNLVVYAGWRQIQYRVFLHPQAGKDPSLNWGNDKQALNFRVSYNEKVSAPTGLRDLYEFGDWYLDSACHNRFFWEVTTLTEQTVTTPYIKKENLTDSMDKWGFIHDPVNRTAFNSDTIGYNGKDRFWITKKLDLYARWRHKLDGSEGVKVEYVCDGCEASSMPKPDTNLYLDKSKMVAGPAATSAVHNKIFAYWVLQNWNPTKGRFVDSLDADGKPVFVYPGGPYTLHLPYTRREQITEDSAVYVYQLRAELESFEDNRTFIVWYRNWGKPDGDTVRYDVPDTLTINMMVTIPYPDEVGEREGYIYKGWHKKGYGPEGSGQESTFEDRLLGDTTTVNSLWYNPKNGQYYSKDYTTLAPDSLEFYRAYGVGADEVTPYDYFYAVWDPIKYTIRFHENTTAPVTGAMPDQVFRYGEEQDLSKIGYLYQCHKFLGWSLTPNGEVVFENQQAILNLTSKSDSIIDLYAQWREESHDLVLSPDSASCLTPGSIDIQLDGVSMPNYTYRVIGLDTTTMQYNDTVWQMVSSGTHITALHLTHRNYRVEVVTGSECMVSKDTAVFLNPVEITWDNPIETVCSGSPFVIKPSTNDDVRYLWDAPDKKAAAVVSPDTANENNPQEYILCTITNSADSSVTYNIHAILGNCQLGDVPTKIDVSTTNYPPFEITISAATDTLCGGTPLEVTATVNDNIYNNNPYKLNWVFNGDTVSSTVEDHSPNVARALTMPDTCRGDFSVEVYYANVTECHVNAVKNFKVRIADWDIPANQASTTIHCVKDTVRPHTIPGIMPDVPDGCGNTLIPTLYNTVVEPADLSCNGTVTYTYEYEDCEGKEKYWSYVYHVEKQAPEITITEVPAPTPIDFCRYQIPEIGYTLSDCDPTLVTVTQTPSSSDHIQQIDHDSAVTITLTATDKCGLTATETTTVTIPARPTVTPTAENPEFCLGETTRVTAATTGTSSASVITWSATPSTGEFTYGTDTTFTTTTHDPYTLTATVVENGCLATGETSVSVKPSAELTVTNRDQTICFGASISNVNITLLYTDQMTTAGTLPAGVNLHTENNGSVISGTPEESGTFKLYLTAPSPDPACGVTKDSVTIEILPQTEGTVSISGDTVFCEGKTTRLSVDPDAKSYKWANSDGILPYTKSYLTVFEPGIYSVTVTAFDGCVTTGSQKVTWNPRPAVELVLPSPICPGDNVQQLQANITSIDKSPYKYFWDIDQDASFNETKYQAEPTVTMPIRCETTTYTVTLILEDSSQCQKTVTGTILMKNEPPTISRKKESIILSPDGNCKYYIPNSQALDTLVDFSGNCTPTENLTLSIFCPSANEDESITSTDSVTITTTDSCHLSASTKIEVQIPEGMSSVEKDSIVLNSFEWEGAYYNQSTTVESTSSDNACRIDRVHFTVLHTNKPDTAICEGDTANLVVKMEQPVRPAVGDVLCLKPTGTNVYDTLVLRPDTFVTRAATENLTPIGVVFYVDPDDDRKGKALALVDAYSEACKWSSNNSVNDGNPGNSGNRLKAALDLNGTANTSFIQSNFSGNAPAASYCYHYDPLTQSTATNSTGWYLPAAGEVNLWFAQRLAINRTMALLKSEWTSRPVSFKIDIPFDKNDSVYSTGYWTSTDYDNTNNKQAIYINQNGEISAKGKSDGGNIRAVCSFVLNQNGDLAQVSQSHKIGDIITFSDGSQGVVCYLNPEKPYSGWAAALQDIDNNDNQDDKGLMMLLPAMNSNQHPNTGITNIGWITAGDNNNAPNAYTGFGRTEWESQTGYASGMVNTRKLLRISNSPLKGKNIDTSNWYIPDMMQLRQWYALYPLIKDVQGVKLPEENWTGFYWSSTGTKKEDDFGGMRLPQGTFESKRGTNSANKGHIRLVRDFDLSISWDNNAVASSNPLADTMQVSPSATQKYYATVKFCGWTLRDSATVIVATKPKITAKNDTADRLLGCNPASIPIMTVDSFTVEDNSKPDAKVSLTRRDTSGIERSLTWTATYQNQCGQNADTVRVTYRWCELSVKAKDSTKVFDGEALPATFVCTPSGTTPTVRYKVKNGDIWSDYTTDIPSITHAGSLTYLVEVTSGSCNCTVTDTATLTITKRPVKFTATSEEKSYTGSEITINNLTVSSGENEGLVNGHTHNATFSASGTEVGEHPGTITAANNVTIMSGDNDVTASYDISVDNGKLTITKTSAEFTISLEDDTCLYNATARHNMKTASSTAATGTTTYSYSFEQNGTYVSDLSSLTKTDVGEYTIYVKGENPNYEKVAMTTSKLTITKRPVTFTAKDEVKTYTGSLITINNLTVNSGENEGLVNGHTHNATFSASGTEAGEYTGTITAASDVTIMSGNNNVTANYDISVENGKLTITKTSAEFTISLANDEYVYDATAHHNTKTASSTAFTGTTTYSYSFEQNGTYVSDLSSLTKTDAGEYTIYVKGTNPNYLTEATTTAKLTITPKAVTVTAKSQAFTYDGTAHSNSGYDVEGLVGSDAITAVVTGSITFPSQSPVANTVENYTFTTGTPGNYSVTTTNGQLTMTEAEVLITITAASDSKTYDGSALTNTTVTVTSGSLLSGDALVATATGSVTNVADVAANNNPIAAEYKVMHGDEDVTANYNITAVAGTLTINPKAVTVTAKSEAFTYDGTAHSNSGYDVVGLVGNDAISAVVTGSITFPSESPVTNVLTSYEFTTGTPGNYSVTTANGELTMTKATVAITITAASDSKTYDGSALTNTTVTVTSGSLLEGDELVATATGSVTNVSETATGNNPIAEGFKIMHGDEDVTANYNITPVAGTLTINPKPVTVSVADKTVEYNGAVQYGNTAYSFQNVLSGHTATIGYTAASGTLASETPYDNGNYANDFKVMAGETDVTSNYTLTTQTPGKLTIKNRTEKYAITVVAKSSTGNVYDGTVKSASGFETLSFVVEGKSYTVSGLTTSNPSSTDVCNLANTISGTAVVKDASDNDVTAQFTVNTTNGTLTVTPKPVTVTAENKAFVYSGEAQSWPQYVVSGLVGSDAITATVTGSITFPSQSPVTNELTSYEFTSGTAGNYSVTTSNGELTMTNASHVITITAASQAWTYDGMPHTNDTVKVTSGTLLTGDSLVATATGSVTSVADNATSNNPIAPGYKVMHGTEDVTANYVFSTQAGKLTITPKAVTVTAKSEEFTYDGTAHSNSGYDVEGLVGTDAITATVTGSITFPSQSPVTNTVESYTFTTGTPGNYSVTTSNGELTMTNASVAITITAASQAWTYDGAGHQNTTVTVTSGNLLTDDYLVATATGSVTDVSETADGNNPIATGYKVMHGSEDVTANYAITPVDGTLTINPKAVTVKAQDKTFAYTGAAQSWPEYDVIGLVGNDAISAVVTGNITFMSESPVTNTLTSYQFTAGTPGNYSVTTANGQLTMTNASQAITITAASQTWTYDGNPHQNTTVTVTEGALHEGDTLEAHANGNVTNVSETEVGNNRVAAGYKVMHGDVDVTTHYAITTKPGTLTISARPVTFTATSETHECTGTPITINNLTVNSGENAGLVNGHTHNVAFSASGVEAGEYTGSITTANDVVIHAGETDVTTNYDITVVNGKLTVTKINENFTITLANDSYVYDAMPHHNSKTVSSTAVTGTTTNSYSFEESGPYVSDLTSLTKVNAGTYTIYVKGTNPNYVNTATTTSLLTITPKLVTVTAKSDAFTYNGTAQSNNGFDVDGLVGDDAISAVVTGTITFPSQSPVTNELASYEFTHGTPGNYTVTKANGQLTMANAHKEITITAASQAWTYDGMPHTNDTVKVTSGSLLPGDSLVATATGSVTKVSETATGNNPIAEGFKIMHGDEDVTANYAITTVAGTLTITPKAVTVTAKSQAFTYDGTAHSNSGYDVEGLVGSDAITAVVTGSITFPSQSPVANTVENYTFTTGTPGNYSVTMTNGQLTMTEAEVLITITAASDSKTYDGSALTNATVTVTSGELLTGDVLVATATGSATNVADVAANNNPIAAEYKVMHGDEDVTANYNITAVAGTLTINPKAVTVTAKSEAFTYDGTAHSNSGYDVVGLVGNDAISAVVTGSITFPSESPVTNVLTSYEFTTGTPGNYNVTTANGELTMTKATVAITITAASDSKTYDGSALTNTTVTVTSGSLLEGDELVATATGSVTNVSETATGNNPIAEGFKIMHGDEDVTANYNITPVAGTLTINPKPVTVSVADKTVEYNGAVQYGNTAYTFQNVLSGHTATIGYTAANGTLASATPYDNGSYANDFKVMAGETDVTSNYTLTTQTPGKLTIKNRTEKYAITVVAKSSTGNVYDGTVKSASGFETLSFVVEGKSYTVSGLTTSNPSSTDVCNIANTISGTAVVKDASGNDVTAQFTVNTTNGTLTVTPKPVTVTAENKAFVYSGAAQSWPQYVVSGLVGSDAITATITSNITFPSQSPVPNVVESYSFTTGTASNYTVSLVPGQLTMVNAAVPITITAASQEWTYDGAAHSNPAVSVTSGTLLTGDSLVATATGSVTNVSETAVGNTIAPGYKVMHGTEDVTANYVFTTQFGKLTIKPKAVTVTANSDAFTYDGTAHSNNGYVVNGLVGSDAISAVVTGSITFPSQSPVTNTVGSYTFTTGTPGNYSVTKTNGQLTMTEAEVLITITAASDSKTYDGTALTNATVTVTSGNLLTGDELVANANGSVTNVDDVTTGNNTIAPNYKIMHGTEDVTANYAITPVAGTLEITPRTVTVRVANKTVEYNGAVQNGNTTCTFENVVAGQTATIGYTAANGLLPSETPYDNSSYDDNFTVMAGTTDVTSNYILSTRTPGNLTIRNRTQKFPITVQSNSNYGNVYDGSVKSASGFQTLSFTFNNNTFTVSGLTTSDPNHSEVCDLPNAISGTAKVTDAHNHDVTEQFNVSKLEGRLTIQKRPVTVSVADKTVNYNGSLQYGDTASTFNNVVSGQTATIGYTASSGIMESTVPYDNGNYGSNFQVMSDATNVTSNYTLTLMKKGKLKIDPAPLTVTAKDSTKTYDGMALQASFTFESNESQPTIRYKVKSGDTWSDYLTDAPSITNAGSLIYLVEASISSYTTSDTATLTITKRDVTVTVADTLNVEYNGNEHHSDKVPVFHNVVAGQTPSITYHPAHGTVVGEYVGRFDTISFKVVSGIRNLTANYNLTTLTPGRLTIVNRSEKYTLNVVAKSDTDNIYDGLTHSAIGYDTVVHLNNHLYTVTGLTTSNPSSKNVCEMTNILSGTPVVKDNHGNDVTNQFNVNLVNGLLRIQPRPILLRSKPGVKLYDSTALTRNAQSDVIVEGDGFVGNEGATYHITGSQRYVGMSYNTFTYTLNEGTLASNYLISTQFGTLTVNPDTFSLLIESKPGEWVFDNQTHRRDEYRVVYKNVARSAVPGTNGLVFVLPTKDTLTITPTFGGITHKSENADSNNTFTYTLQHSDQYAGNHDTVFGTLKILSRSVTVRIIGHAGIRNYTGDYQSVTGYTVHTFDTLYKASYFEYSGDSIATRRESGKTMMNLQANDFTNLNPDFAPVDFVITDGEIIITPDTNAAVILAGRHSMVDYNGQPHSVYGYEIVSITSNYSASDFEFIGTWEDSTATRTNAGITWMGLSDTMFRNVNPNFHDVTFVLQSDGYLQINSIEATVKVTGRADTREYDGTEHSITGYDLEISPSLYTVNDFTFNGCDTAKRTVKGTTWMGLAESQFVNTNPNFSQVIFTITDGKQTITPNASALTLHCPSGDTISKIYDGTPLSVAATASSTIPNDVFDIKYKTKLEGQSTWNDWSTTPPSITNFGILFVEVSCSNPNYMPQSCTYALSILKRDVHLTSMDSTRIYNGDTLRYDSVKVTGNGFVNGEGATFTVTGSQLLPGSAPNLFDYTLNPGTLAENYEITKSYGTLHVDERPDSLLYQITVVSNSNPEANGSPIIYDGLKHTASDFVTLTFTTEDGHPYTVTGLTANVSGFDAGTYPNTIHGNPTVLDEHSHDVTDQFYTELVKGNLVIRKRPVTITVPSEHATMMYNGDSLRVDYENIDISTLAARDTLTSGYIISEGYTIGTYHCNDGMFMATTGVASKHDFNIVHGATEEYAAGNSMANYRPRFNVTLTITKRPLEITASSAEKVYDGNPLTLTESDYTLTGGTSIAPSDTLIITRSGAQACVGESANHITSVTILHKDDGVDVTYCYNISTVDGLIKVTAANTGLTSPETLNITLGEGTYDTLVPQSLLGMPSHDLLDAGVASVSNDLDEQNPLTVGTHTIKWILYDTCHTAMDSCYQTVVVNFSPCEGVTYHGHFYDAKRIGYQCWMTENLRNETDAEGHPIANRHAYKEIPENLDKFGYLYSWYSAMNVPEGDDTAIPADSIGDNGRPYVQGICPDGWAVGDHQDFSVLFDTVNNTTLLKDAGDGYWLPEFGGTLPNSGFNARANGLFKSSAQRYEDLLTGAHFWLPESGTASGTATSAVLQYYCSNGLFQENPKADLMGVRCIRKVAP